MYRLGHDSHLRRGGEVSAAQVVHRQEGPESPQSGGSMQQFPQHINRQAPPGPAVLLGQAVHGLGPSHAKKQRHRDGGDNHTDSQLAFVRRFATLSP